jgi:hypothetical protein
MNPLTPPINPKYVYSITSKRKENEQMRRPIIRMIEMENVFDKQKKEWDQNKNHCSLFIGSGTS